MLEVREWTSCVLRTVVRVVDPLVAPVSLTKQAWSPDCWPRLFTRELSYFVCVDLLDRMIEM